MHYTMHYISNKKYLYTVSRSVISFKSIHNSGKRIKMSTLYERSVQHYEKLSHCIEKRSSIEGNVASSSFAAKINTDLVSMISKTYFAVGNMLSKTIEGSDKRDQNMVIDKNDARWSKFHQQLGNKLNSISELHIYPHDSLEIVHFSIKIFSSLMILHLDQCPPSTIADLVTLKNQLNTLTVVNSGITDLDKVFIPFDDKSIQKLRPMIFAGLTRAVPEQYMWSALINLRLSNCGISRLDQSMHFFPNLEYLDLSYNLISRILHLQDCISLQYLNLSHNKIDSLSNLDRVLGRVTNLCVSYNEIQTFTGIEKLLSLEVLDASYNQVSIFSNIRGACKLPCLESLCLTGNPLADAENYRLKVYDEFVLDGSVMESNRYMPQLDGVDFTDKEKQKLRKVMFRSAINTIVIQPNTYILEDDVDEPLKKEDSRPVLKGGSSGSAIPAPSLPLTMHSNPAMLKKYKFKVKRNVKSRKVAAITEMNFEEPTVDLGEVADFFQLQRESLVAAKIAAVSAKREAEQSAMAASVQHPNTVLVVSGSTARLNPPQAALAEDSIPAFPSMVASVHSGEGVDHSSLQAFIGDPTYNGHSTVDEVVVYIEKNEQELRDFGQDKPVDEDVNGSYRGDPIYRELLVIENMELYIREQVVRPGQPLYFHSANDSAVVDPTKKDVNERYITLFTEKIIPFDAHDRSQRPRSVSVERYESFTPKRGSTEPQILDMKSARQRRKSGTGKADTDSRVGSSVVDTDIYGPCSPPETRVLIILTDMNVYFVDYSSVEEPSLTFADAPMPLLISDHPIARLFCCTTFFGSHRFMLSFSSEDPVILQTASSSSSSSSDATDDLNAPNRVEDAESSSLLQPVEYMILTRDKTRTFSIITRLTRTANSARQQVSASTMKQQLSTQEENALRLPNVKMCNHDTPFLEAFQNVSMGIIEKLNLDPTETISFDVLHYQMVYQILDGRDDANSINSYNRAGIMASAVGSSSSGRFSFASTSTAQAKDRSSFWRRKSQTSAPLALLSRTIILTETSILLCAEELNCNEVRFVVIDCARTKDISQVIQGAISEGAVGETANGIIIKFRAEKRFSSRRKWKLCTDSALLSLKLAEKCKNSTN